MTADVPYTDVWEFPPVQYYPGKHPCEKPAAMMEHIIRSSSRPGDVVADFFMFMRMNINQVREMSGNTDPDEA